MTNCETGLLLNHDCPHSDTRDFVSLKFYVKLSSEIILRLQLRALNLYNLI